MGNEMSKIVVFGGGGRVGRAVIEEARRRGHQVRAVVRDPSKHKDLADKGIPVVIGDVTDADSVLQAAAGSHVAISTVYDPAADPAIFYTAATGALISGSLRAGVERLVVLGLASVLKSESGVPLMDTPGYPQQYRAFYLGHAAGVDVLRRADAVPNWVVLSPAGDFDQVGRSTGRYSNASADATSLITYADFAMAVLDEIEMPQNHREHLGFRTVAND
jgi:putative NADH-flavin reductase